jgi:DHA1 family arabinose polymer transporter-like MFS transporter
LVILITAIGTGGLFCWISYIVRYNQYFCLPSDVIFGFGGLGMVNGNLIGGKLTDRFSPEMTIIAILLLLSVDLVLVYCFV